ncbi:MAG: glycosyltransferase family 4 protein [Xenococcaceae cyanobacterium MO_167.B27]|nr:glycosyltransferase family 4 protein [Xenococcaceae cyanobacterium MO_167.B27]
MSNDYKRAIVTICSSNYFPYARILFNSLQKYHPEASLFLCLADKLTPEIDLGIEGVEIIPAEKLSISNFPDFAFRYDIMEFNTAVKPFVMQLLIEERGFEQVVYLDPDIELFAPMTPVFEALNNGAHFVLTPHITQPAEGNEYPGDIGVMKAGIYNLGFIAVDNSIDTIEFLHWWGRKLRFQCINQQDQGIFVDQKFVDLLPAFHDNVAILRDTTLNVAYWNLTQRKLEKAETGWLADGKPLIFFHFSGIDPKNPHRLSKHTEGFKDNLELPVQAIIQHYISQLKEFGYDEDIKLKYGYGVFSNGLSITTIMRRCYRSLEYPGLDNPFDTFYEYLNKPSQSLSPWLVTNLMYSLWKETRDLQVAFDLDNPDSCLNYSLWFLENAPDYGIESYFYSPVLDVTSQHLSPGVISKQNFNFNTKQIGVIGYLKTETGVGQAGRMVARSCQKVDFTVEGYNVSFNVVSRQEDSRLEDIIVNKINSQVHIYKVNADQLTIVRNNIKKYLNKPNFIINMPAWELRRFPQQWAANLQDINEIWVESRFVQASLQSALKIPVIWMPPAISIDGVANLERARFNIPDNSFAFHFNFDFASFSSRKNPQAVIETYNLAQQKYFKNLPTVLVIKTRGYDPEGKSYQRLMDLVGDNPNIIVINEYLTHPEALGLMNCCDCYVSLHRSEGFGYTLAEAMLLNKPVISTNYSGTTDFINYETGFPVNYQLISLKPDEYPFAEGQKWADPDLNHAAWLMNKIVNNPQETKKIADAGKQQILQNHSPMVAGQRYRDRLLKIGVL